MSSEGTGRKWFVIGAVEKCKKPVFFGKCVAWVLGDVSTLDCGKLICLIKGEIQYLDFY